MKKLIVNLCLVVMWNLTASNVWALYYTPTLDDIASWTQQDISSLGLAPNTGLSTTDNRPWTQDVTFAGTFASSSSSYDAYIMIGTNVTLDLSGYDEYILSIYNGNENIWDFSLYLKDTSGEVVTTATPIINTNRTNISMSLTGLSAIDLSNITEIGFKISATVPLGDPNNPNTTNYPDYTFEAKVAPVPEPATIMLMGIGLIGIGGWVRKYQVKKG